MISEKNMGEEIIKQPEKEKKYEEIMNAVEQGLEEMSEETNIKAAELLPLEEFKKLMRFKIMGIKEEQRI